MELTEYLAIMRSRWLSIVLLAALGAATALGVTMAIPPTYSARAQVFISVRGADSVGDLQQGVTFVTRAIRSYSQVATTPQVLEPVIEELGLPQTTTELAEQITAESPLDTVLINLTASDPSPQLAAEIANATARSLSRVVAELETPAAGGDSPVQVSIVQSATVPEAPSSPNLRLNLALGLLLGLALGVGLAILREVLNTRVRDVADVEALSDAPILGAIPYDANAGTKPLIIFDSPRSQRAEAFRRLRTNLQFLDVDDASRAIVLTSSLPTEGKSSTAINLAITLADAGNRVCLVDADLRRPSIANYLGLEGSVGLTTVLIGRAGVTDVTQPWGNGNLDVITAGQVPPNPSELLGSDRMRDLLVTLCASYDVVLVDTAPLLPVTDAAILARLVGAAVIVIGAGTVHKGQVSAGIDALDAVKARILGTVVNRVPTKARAGYYGYSYYEYASEVDEPGTGHRNRATRDSQSGRGQRSARIKHHRRLPRRGPRVTVHEPGVVTEATDSAEAFVAQQAEATDTVELSQVPPLPTRAAVQRHGDFADDEFLTVEEYLSSERRAAAVPPVESAAQTVVLSTHGSQDQPDAKRGARW